MNVTAAMSLWQSLALEVLDGGIIEVSAQAGSGMGRTVANKLATQRRMLVTTNGKENGTVPAAGKDYIADRIPATQGHQMPVRRQEGRGYEPRYMPHDYPAINQDGLPPMQAW